MEWVLLWAGLSIVAAMVARSRGRSFFGYLLLSLLLSPLLGLLLAALLRPVGAELERRQLKSGASRKCPRCAELVKTEATVCKHCAAELPAPW